MKFRSEAQRRAWLALTPNKRRILTSHLPDDLERDMSLRHSIVTALENVFGPRVWGPDAARIEDGDDDGEARRAKGNYAPEMTYAEIGEEMGLSVERVRQIEQSAFRKIAKEFGFLHHFVSEDSEERHRAAEPQSTPEDIEAAIERARRAA